MTDVEKYGLFAVVLVGGLVLVIGLQGGFSGDSAVVADDALPVVMAAPATLRPQAAGGAGDAAGKVVRVRSILPEKPFQWDESPAPYPGERSTDAPATVTPLAGNGPAAPARTSGLLAGKASPGAASAAGTHTVAAGETLSDIAERHLGSPNRWQELVILNPGINPKKLQIGQVLRVSGAAPAVAAAPAAGGTTGAAAAPALKAAGQPARTPDKAAPAAKGHTHKVVAGDTLSSIAKAYLGSATRADDIYAANRDVLKSPDQLKLGQTLKIP